jgi:hypothetical protein
MFLVLVMPSGICIGFRRVDDCLPAIIAGVAAIFNSRTETNAMKQSYIPKYRWA